MSGIRSRGVENGNQATLPKEGIAILYRDGHYDRTLALARLGVLPFFWIACAVVYGWGKRFFDPVVAVLAVFLFSFLPPVLAHAGVAATDMAVTAFLGATLVAGVVLLEEPSLRAGALVGAHWFRSCRRLRFCRCAWGSRWLDIWLPIGASRSNG